MIDVRQAVEAARDYAASVYPQDVLNGMRVEEIEMSDDGSNWHITLGWAESATAGGGIAPFTTATVEALPRVYKVFTVDAESGQVKSMKIRD